MKRLFKFSPLFVINLAFASGADCDIHPFVSIIFALLILMLYQIISKKKIKIIKFLIILFWIFLLSLVANEQKEICYLSYISYQEF